MNAFLLSLKDDASAAAQWDYGFVKDLLEGRLWRTPDWQDFTIINTDILPMVDRAIVVLPARHHKGLEAEVNDELWQIKHVVLFLIGDEEAEFDISKLTHPSIHIWVQNPHPGKHNDYDKIGTGYPQHIHNELPAYAPKTTDVYFAGQITHERRFMMHERLLEYSNVNQNVEIERTKGFTQGVPPADYYKHLATSKIAPAPAGAIIPDSFRVFEALETMTLVIADGANSQGTIRNYWQWFFGYEPFATTNDWDNLHGYINDLLEGWPANMHKQTAWWIGWKRQFVYDVMKQLNGGL